jgi:hypothetical protein
MRLAKVLKAGTALMMWTLADNAAWVTKYKAVTERLKAKEAAVKAGASAERGTGVRDAAQQSKPVEVAPGATRLCWSRGDG